MKAPTKPKKAKATTVQEPQPEKDTPVLEKAEGTPGPEVAEPKPDDVMLILDALTATILEHTQQITELQETLARKRKPTRNGKVQIRDKQTGKTYPSKNNCYQTLLKSGELKDLVDAGVFGPDPAKNTFGWYALVRTLPDRFEEITAEQVQADGKA